MIALLSWLNATKNLWMVGVIVIGSAGLFAGYKSHEAKKIAAAVEAARAKVSAEAVAAAAKTAEAEREAFDTTPIPPNKSAIVDLCKRSASCRERSILK